MRLVLWIEHLLFFWHVLLWCVLRAGGLALLHGQRHNKVLSFSRRAILCRRQAALKAIQLTLFWCRLSWIQATESQPWLCATGALAAFALASRHDVAPSCPEAEIKNKTHVNPLGAPLKHARSPRRGGFERAESGLTAHTGGLRKEVPQKERTGASAMGAMPRVHCTYSRVFAVARSRCNQGQEICV